MEELEKVEKLFWIVSGLGSVLFVASIFFVKPGKPVASFNPRHWKPIWKMKDYYRGPGYALARVGLVWIGGGTLALIAIWLIGSGAS